MLAGRGQTIPASGKYFMYEDLKKLFGSKTPSVRQFKAKLKKLSEEEQCFYRKAALEAAFLDWENMPPRYQEFMTDLFTHRWQKTLDYLLQSTVMGSLRFESLDPVLLQQVVTLIDGKQESGYMPSFPHLAFVFMLAIKVNYSVKHFCKLLRENKLTENDFWYFYKLTKHQDEPGKRPDE